MSCCRRCLTFIPDGIYYCCCCCLQAEQVELQCTRASLEAQLGDANVTLGELTEALNGAMSGKHEVENNLTVQQVSGWGSGWDPCWCKPR